LMIAVFSLLARSAIVGLLAKSTYRLLRRSGVSLF
jgi:hypothetical protein